MEVPATIGTSEENFSPQKISLKERSTTNWRDRKILDDNGFVTLDQKRMSTPMSRNNDDYTLNDEENNANQWNSKQGDLSDYLKNSPYGKQGK